MAIWKLLILCVSAFKIFQQLYDSYPRKADERLLPLFLTDEQYINTEAALPISHICENLPALRVNLLVMLNVNITYITCAGKPI